MEESRTTEEEEIIDLIVGSYPMQTQETQTIEDSSVRDHSGKVLEEQQQAMFEDTLLQGMIDSTPIMENLETQTPPSMDSNVSTRELPVITKNGKKFMTLKNIMAKEKEKGKGP